jgi:hypothetical protein
MTVAMGCLLGHGSAWGQRVKGSGGRPQPQRQELGPRHTGGASSHDWGTDREITKHDPYQDRHRLLMGGRGRRRSVGRSAVAIAPAASLQQAPAMRKGGAAVVAAPLYPRKAGDDPPRHCRGGGDGGSFFPAAFTVMPIRRSAV